MRARYFLFFYLLLGVGGVHLCAAEPSGFNAGGSVPPKSQLDTLQDSVFGISSTLKALEESQQGLRSVFDGQSRRVQELSNRINVLEDKQNKEIARLDTNLSKLDSSIANLTHRINENFTIYDENFQKLKDAVATLGALVIRVNNEHGDTIKGLKDSIVALNQKVQEQGELLERLLRTTSEGNSSFYLLSSGRNESVALQDPSKHRLQSDDSNITQEVQNLSLATMQGAKKISSDGNASVESENLNVGLEKHTTSDIKDTNKENKKVEESAKKQEEQLAQVNAQEVAKESLESKESLELFNEAEDMFQNKQLDEAKARLEITTQRNYKPARGNFLLGEIAFLQKSYRDAIYYYKTSATRYDKADYMPRLLLNSAKSFNAVNERDNAKKFLNSLINLYPKSKEAKEAKKLLKS